MPDALIYITIIGLVGYGVSNLLVIQDGPFNLFFNIRKYFGIVETDDLVAVDTEKTYILSNVFIRNEHNLIGEILSCQYCAGVWVIIAATIVSLISIKILLPFAALGLLYALLDSIK